MIAYSHLCRGVIGIQLLFLGATVACAQTFVFDFRNTLDNSPPVYSNIGGTSIISDWDASSNLLDDSDGSQNPSGSVFFELNPGQPYVTMLLGANVFLNWTQNGLGDGSNGFSEANEFVSFKFNKDVHVDTLDFKGFSLDSDLNNGDATDRVDILFELETVASFAGLSGGDDGERGLDMFLPAHQTMVLAYDNGEFFLESMTISAVPEPGTIVLSILGAGIAFFAARRRPRAKTDRRNSPSGNV